VVFDKVSKCFCALVPNFIATQVEAANHVAVF
jgi:hypothetical protein